MDTFAIALGIQEWNVEEIKKSYLEAYSVEQTAIPGAFPGWQKNEMTLEHRKKLSEAKKGKKLSESHRQNILNNRVGKKNSPEHKAALIKSRIGSKHSEESKKKMSESRKNNENLKQLASNAGKISAIKRKESGYYQTEEYKEKCKLSWEKRRANKLAKHKGGIR